MLIDTHAHVNSEKFEGEREQIIANDKIKARIEQPALPLL